MEEGLDGRRGVLSQDRVILSSEHRAEPGRGQVRSVFPKQLWISDSQSTKCPVQLCAACTCVHRLWQREMKRTVLEGQGRP